MGDDIYFESVNISYKTVNIFEEMYEKNDASELCLLYNEFVDSLRDTVTWHSALIELDERIRDKIESIEIRLNELAK